MVKHRDRRTHFCFESSDFNTFEKVQTEMPDVDEFAQCTRVSCYRGIP